MTPANPHNTPPKKRRRRRVAPNPLVPLPILPQLPAHAPTTTICVEPIPTMEETDGLTWVVQERPQTPVGKGQTIHLRTETQMSGAGRIGHVTALRHHWITLSILGASHKVYLRVPTAWVTLEGLEAITHTKHYLTLSPSPRPPISLRSPIIEDPHTNPYEFDLDDEEVPGLESRIRKITRQKQDTDDESSPNNVCSNE